MATDEKKRQLYGGSYDAELGDLYNKISNRPAFSYDVNGDALYQQYKDRYTQNAKMAMKDTMGQAAGLTGGYGNSYGQAVGQQAYDRQMLGLTDKIPELQQNAYGIWRDQGNELKDQYSMLNSMAATEQATGQQAYSQLAQLISTSGYQPTADDLAKAGMNSQQANALRQMWIASNPGAAYINGQLSSSDYFKLTGQYPPDVLAQQQAAAAAASSGRGGYSQGSGNTKTLGDALQTFKDDVHKMILGGASASETRSYMSTAYKDYGITDAEMKQVRDSIPILKPKTNQKGNGGR